jgi:hypothetical protein
MTVKSAAVHSESSLKFPQTRGLGLWCRLAETTIRREFGTATVDGNPQGPLLGEQGAASNEDF